MGFLLFPIIKNKIKKHKGVMKLKKKNWKKRRIEETNISWLSKKKKIHGVSFVDWKSVKTNKE